MYIAHDSVARPTLLGHATTTVSFDIIIYKFSFRLVQCLKCALQKLNAHFNLITHCKKQ